ncbi:MAG: TIGR04283 family arsenosugar biosynthesis glycosyltransferase [Gammaproteobacteria bacterium]|nr:TIGR04283 family arsenosugar biosynthesis glycosyltransferase [Gammaproteobacteria bacterium]
MNSIRHKISIIIPVLNEAEMIQEFLKRLQPLRNRGHEIVLVDGGSQDDTCILAKPYIDQIIASDKGRAKQQALGATLATGDIFLFLHADTFLPDEADQIIVMALYSRQSNPQTWGRFNVRLSGEYWLFRVIETMMNWRSCLTGIATGDQAIFVTSELYNRIGGMPLIDLMEDIELSKCLRKQNKPVCVKSTVTTSSRRWEKNGVLKTIFFMWNMRLQYFFGVKPEVLVKKYYS